MVDENYNFVYVIVENETDISTNLTVVKIFS